jgi:hypothetical protein
MADDRPLERPPRINENVSRALGKKRAERKRDGTLLYGLNLDPFELEAIGLEEVANPRICFLIQWKEELPFHSSLRMIMMMEKVRDPLQIIEPCRPDFAKLLMQATAFCA